MYDLGSRLKTIRLQRGLTQRQLAARVNKSVSAISSYESAIPFRRSCLQGHQPHHRRTLGSPDILCNPYRTSRLAAAGGLVALVQERTAGPGNILSVCTSNGICLGAVLPVEFL